MSKVVSAVIGVAMIAVGVATGNWLLVAQGVATVGSVLLAKTPNQQRQAQQTTLQLGEQPRVAIFGEGATGGGLLDGFNYGGKYGTDWEVLIIALADHKCHSLTGFYVNDVYVAFAGNGVVSGYNSQLEVYFLPGTEGQAWPSVVTTYGSGWTNDDNCAGVACVVVAYKADSSKAKNPIWSGGRPRFLWVVKGKYCYDPRFDSTVAGGSGAHRWNDPGTWAWTDNAAICRYNYQRGIYAVDRVDQPEQLLLGRGLSAIEAPPERAFAPANLCDEDVALKAGGTEKRYRVGGVIDSSQSFLEAEEAFAAAMGGIILQPEGGIEVEPGQAKSAVATITDDDLIIGEPVQYERFRGEADDEWCNTVVPRYVEPSQKWKDHAAPIRRVTADVIADGRPREHSPSLALVTSGTQAQRCGEIVRRLARLTRTGTVTLPPRFVGLEEGDWIAWQSDRWLGGATILFRINSYARSAQWRMTLQLREIAASCFSWDAATDELDDSSESENSTVPPAIGAPDAESWTLTGDTAPQPMLIIVGSANEDPYAEAVIFEFRLFGEADWTSAGVEAADVTRKEINVPELTAYEAAVSYRVDGVIGDRLVLGPVVAGTSRITANGSVRVTSDGKVRVIA